MIRKIGITMVGLAALISFVAGGFVMVFREELTQWQETPPGWIWYAVFGLAVFGTVGLIMGLSGE